MGLKFELKPDNAAVTALKSDQNGIEITKISQPHNTHRQLKSDQNGIEMHEP